MRFPRFDLAAGAAAVLLCLAALASTTGQAQEPEGNYGIGIPDVFLPKYLAYRTQQLNGGSPDVMTVNLGYVKGLSRSFTSMTGAAALNLESGTYRVDLNGLTPATLYTVWLVDRPEIDLPDTVFSLASVVPLGSTALLTGLLPLNLPLGFAIDRVVVTPGLVWGVEPLGAGTVNVFQKLFFRRSSILNESTGAVLFDETTPAPTLSALVPDLAAETDALGGLIASPFAGLETLSMAATSSGSSGGSVKLDKLISEGAKLFFEETFEGNGRTCGTCHPSSNNLTIDAAFISTRPANDPLFVAEFNPALAQLERPQLMRSFGLILENLDGFSDPTNKFVMRGVPHTLGLQVSLARDAGLVPAAPAEMTGWSGDGAPGTGSLREFAIGAVTQHFTKTLQRVSGRDFVLPSEHQLDAMEAFQLSTGRDKDFDLTKITFNNTRVDNGRFLFINGAGNPNVTGGRCVGCHANAGALAANNQNLNLNTNVEDVVHPARSIQNFPKDGGFGQANNGDGTFGNRTFNVASVVEAAESAPFFHNNVVDTLENVVRFYSGPEFNNPRAGTARFNFNATQIDDLADFMRGVNTLQNIDVARRELQEILANTRDPQQEQNTRLQSAFEDTQDGINVLNEGGIFPSAVTKLTSARNFISQAQNNNDPSQRRLLVQNAIGTLGQARSIVATVSP